MLEEFLDVMYEKTSRQQATIEVSDLFNGLPDWEVEKIASGMPISELYGHLDRKPLTKTASECGPDGEPKTFLDRFKGTPLFDQAVALEQEELQAEMLDLQKRQESRANRQNEDTIWDAKDRLRVRKRLLELELAKQQGGVAAGVPAAGEPVGDTAQGAGAPGPVPAEGVQDSSGGLGGGVAKMGSASSEWGKNKDKRREVVEDVRKRLGNAIRGKDKHAEDTQHLAMADRMGRILARTEKTAAEKTALSEGMASGIGTIIGKGMLGLHAAAKHPAAAGALLGAAGGAIAGGPDHRLSGALGGAALGGGVGHLAAPSINKGMAAGAAHMKATGGAEGALGAAGSAFKSDAMTRGQGAMDRIRGVLGGGTPSPKA